MTVPASSYNPLIPQATDAQNNSQLYLLNNFGALETWIDQDHVDASDPDAGKHFRVTLPVQSVTPTFSGTDTGFFNEVDSTTNLQEVVIHKLLAGGTPANVSMTASILSTDLGPTALQTGWTRMPSGILLMWGFSTANGLTTITVPVSADLPIFNTMMTVMVFPKTTSSSDPNIAVTLQNILSTTQFNVFMSSRTTTGAAAGSFGYLIIGY